MSGVKYDPLLAKLRLDDSLWKKTGTSLSPTTINDTIKLDRIASAGGIPASLEIGSATDKPGYDATINMVGGLASQKVINAANLYTFSSWDENGLLLSRIYNSHGGASDNVAWNFHNANKYSTRFYNNNLDGTQIQTMTLNRDYIGFYDDVGTSMFLIDRDDKKVKINKDNIPLTFGAGDDSSITFDGTRMIINPEEVGNEPLDVTGTIRSTALSTATTGEGVEMGYYNGEGYFQSYDRDGSVYTPINFNGSTVSLNPGGTVGLLVTATRDVHIPADNKKLLFGAGQDASIYFNGENLVIDTQEVGSGNLLIPNGNVGIGTGTAPSYKLTVEGVAADTAISTQAGLNFDLVAAPSTAPTLTPTTGGALGAGSYWYFVTYVTALGETDATTRDSVVTDATNNAVDLTDIPTSSDPRVTQRKIYRTKVGASGDQQYYLATISDNTTTTYTDIIADVDLTGARSQWNRPNTTSNMLTVDGAKGMIMDANLTRFGIDSGDNLDGSTFTTIFGADNLADATAPGVLCVFGSRNAKSLISGKNNFIFGELCGGDITTANSNILIGSQVMREGNNSQNVAIGNASLRGVSSNIQNYNTAIGQNAARSTATATYSVFLGYAAGYNGSQKLDAHNSMSLGANTYTSESNQVVLGNGITQTIFGRSDNNLLLLGAGLDSSITDTGSLMTINPDVNSVGSRPLTVSGDVSIPSDKKFYMDGGTNTYMTYNSSTSKVEMWVNGSKKASWG